MYNTAALLFVLGAYIHAGDIVDLRGIGGTFPEELYKKWTIVYHKQNPTVRISYQGISSGAGIKSISEGTVDFGGSDAPMTEQELKKAPAIVHIPSILGAISLGYNLPTVPELKLSPESTSAIFLGDIRRWNDPKIAADNPGVRLPDLPITIFHRADASGTTSILTDYLSKISKEWKERVGSGKTVSWPVGVGLSGSGTQGLAERVKQTPGGVAPLELGFSLANKLGVAAIKNRAGKFVFPTPRAVFKAVEATPISSNFRTSITDPSGPEAYPIASFTYILVRRYHPDEEKGQALAEFLFWAVTDGQAAAPLSDYAPLPKPLVEEIKTKIRALLTP
jgi:phosphate transport system substrate-binding protein